MDITSAANPRVKTVVKLRDSHHRKALGRFIIEGPRCIDRALAAGIEIAEAFICEDLPAGADGETTAHRLRESAALSFNVPTRVFDKMAYRRRGDGLLAVAVRPKLSLAGLPAAERGLYVVAAGLEKPGNLGAILRSMDAAGADGLILCDRRTDVYNPNAIRASTGAVFTVPIAEASGEEVVAWLHERGIDLAATICAGGRDYAAVDWARPAAILLGSEDQGLDDTLKAAADFQVTIPMQGAVDSLNVAAVATILLFEAARQRRAASDA